MERLIPACGARGHCDKEMEDTKATTKKTVPGSPASASPNQASQSIPGYVLLGALCSVVHLPVSLTWVTH